MRKIIHIDMDAFYASVEQRDNPELRGKPVIVGGPPGSRSVVATCSYEARKFGIHSAMSSTRAHQLCPQAIFVPPRFRAYKDVSDIVRSIFLEYTDLIEPLSLDEAYLDVTVNKKNLCSATLLAREILQQIKERTGLTASAGVSYNKFLAKVASAYQKPHGLTVITPEQAAGFIDKLPVGKFYGVGKVTEKAMFTAGIRTGADLKKREKWELIKLFGKMGEFYYNICRGVDERPVVYDENYKSVGREITLAEDVSDLEEISAELQEIAADLSATLQKKNISGCCVTLKVKYEDFILNTRSRTVEQPVQQAGQILENALFLLRRTEAGRRKIRLLGISVSGLIDNSTELPRDEQLYLPFVFD